MSITVLPAHLRRVLTIAALTAATPVLLFGGSFPDTVHAFVPGTGAGFGQAYFPGNVLAPPNGNSNPNTPNFSEQDLLSLGDGGRITLRFVNNRIVDGPGPDFIVFENPLQPVGEPNQSFSEVAVVEVSDDGQNWVAFPFDYIPPGTTGSLLDMANYVGFAGVRPVLSSPGNGITPFDPALAGGDPFDLADIGIPSVRYVRLIDTGSTTTDAQGDVVMDPGNIFSFEGTAGFDLDAVAAIHSEPVDPSSVGDWVLYE